jgi:hypothetical protein
MPVRAVPNLALQQVCAIHHQRAEVDLAHYLFLVVSNPVAGREAEFNDWYSRQHLDDVLRVPGFTGARRFMVSGESRLPGRYVAIYELECADPDAVLASLNARAGTPDMPISPALDVANVTIALLAPLTERLSAPRAAR